MPYAPSRLLAALAVIVGALVAAPPGRAAETITLITTGKGAPVEWPLYIAEAKGFFAAHGVAIDMASSPSTAAAMQQVVAGSGDIGVGGLTDPMRAIDQGAKLSLLRLETSVPPYSLWGKPSIKSIADLRGKLIIVGGAKDITRIYFERMAQPNGLKSGDYDFTYAGTTPARYAALASGAVDAAILYPPASFKAPAEGYSKLGELGDYVKDMPFTGYAVNTAWAASHKKVVADFMKAIDESVAWFYDKSNRGAAIDILVKESGADRGDVEKTYDYFAAAHIFPERGLIDADTIASLVKALAETGDLAGAADPARFIDPAMARLME